MKVLGSLLALIAIVIGYGYVDAYRDRVVTKPLLWSDIATAWDLYPDSIPFYQPLDNGQLFLKVGWIQPSDDSRVSTIWVKGAIEHDGSQVATYNSPCVRAGTNWLANGTWTYEDQVCFVKLDVVLVSEKPNEVIRRNEAEAQASSFKIKSESVSMKAVRKPMRYITWLNNAATIAWSTVAQPFTRI